MSFVRVGFRKRIVAANALQRGYLLLSNKRQKIESFSISIKLPTALCGSGIVK